MKAILSAVFVILSISPLLAAPAAGPGYHVVKRYKLGGEGGWDYLEMDSTTRRLYISRATHVIVIDPDNGKQVGEIADTPGVHGVALVPEFKRGFTSNGREGTVSVFDLGTLRTLKKIKVGENPDAILYDSFTKRVFTFNGRSHDSSAINASTGEVVGTIRLDGKPEFAVTDGEGRIFVNIEDKNELTAIDAKDMTVKSSWPLTGCEAPSGLSIDKEHHRLFSGCSENKLMAVSDGDGEKLVTTLPICDGTDGTRYDAGTELAFASCHDGHLTVIREESPDKFVVVQTVTTELGARTLALDPKTHDIYTVTAKFGPRPAPSAGNTHPWPTIVPDSFEVLVVGK